MPVGHAGAQEGEEAQDGEREEEDGIQPLPETVHGSTSHSSPRRWWHATDDSARPERERGR